MSVKIQVGARYGRGMAKAGPRTKGRDNDDLRDRLLDATVRVLARDGFAHTSGRAVAQEAGTVNGSIFYYFGSMDGLLAATATALSERGVARIREGLGGEDAHREWPTRLASVLRAEAEGEDGRAVMELFVGSRTSPALAGEVRIAIDRAIDYATTEMQKVLGSSPLAQALPVPLIAELAAATFLGIAVLAQNGREIDLERLTTTIAAGVALLTAGEPPADA
jgi:AcrR family transcriptional regulator